MPVNLPGHEGVDTSLGTGLHLEHRHRTASFLDMDLPPLHMSFIPNTNPGVIDNVMTSMQHNSKYNLAYILLINLSKSRDHRKKPALIACYWIQCQGLAEVHRTFDVFNPLWCWLDGCPLSPILQRYESNLWLTNNTM